MITTRVRRNVPRVALAVALLLGAPAGARRAHAEEEPRPALTPREIAERNGRAVVLIQAKVGDRGAQGSGFVVEPDGAIVTSLHVVDGAERLAVSLHDGTRLEDVAVRAFDVRRDLAVLVVDVRGRTEGLPTVELGDTTGIEPGAKILVIGNPLGLEHTVTEGLVSAWREPREPAVPAPGAEPTSQVLLPPCRLLQISATISPGSSGGPVFDERGEVIAVAAAGIRQGSAGLNFAVPVDELDALLDEDDAMDLVTFGERVDDARLELARPHLEDAELAYERGDAQGASRHVELALLLFPRYPEALLLSGRIAMDAGRRELALERFEQAVQVDEHSPEAWYRLGEVQLAIGIARDDAARYAAAEAALERSLALDDRHAGAALSLAVIQAGRGALDRAEELLLRAVESEPRLIDAHYMLGEVYLRRGRMDEAAEAFERALWENDDHALSHFGLAKLYTEADLSPHGTVSHHGRAPHHWERFLELSEGDPSLAAQREAALRFVQRHFPHLLDR